MTRARMEAIGLNLNTVLLVISILGALITTIFFFEPLRRIPAAMEETQRALRKVEDTQLMQTSALQTIGEVTREVREARKDIDRHSTEIEGAKRRLDRLERDP